MLLIVLVLAGLAGRYLARGWLSAGILGIITYPAVSAVWFAAMAPNMIGELPKLLVVTHTAAYQTFGPYAFIEPALGVLAALGGYFFCSRHLGAKDNSSAA